MTGIVSRNVVNVLSKRLQRLHKMYIITAKIKLTKFFREKNNVKKFRATQDPKYILFWELLFWERTVV